MITNRRCANIVLLSKVRRFLFYDRILKRNTPRRRRGVCVKQPKNIHQLSWWIFVYIAFIAASFRFNDCVLRYLDRQHVVPVGELDRNVDVVETLDEDVGFDACQEVVVIESVDYVAVG